MEDYKLRDDYPAYPMGSEDPEVEVHLRLLPPMAIPLIRP
jgi:hypothetical protein